jgi:hypothetical protein
MDVQIEHETLRRLHLGIGDLADCSPDDLWLSSLADRVGAAFIEVAAAEASGLTGAARDEQPVSDGLIALLDAERSPTQTSKKRNPAASL